MKNRFGVSLSVLALGWAAAWSTSILSAADEKPAPAAAKTPAPAASEKPAPAAAPSPEQKEVSRLFSEWKTLLADLRQLQLKHSTASAEERKTIENRYQELVEQGAGLRTRLIEAAEKAYAAAPHADPELELLLFDATKHELNHDRYEHASTLAELLLKNQCKQPGVDCMAGVAAFALDRFNDAETHLNQAVAKNSINDKGKEFLAELAVYKTAGPKEEQIRQAEKKADDLPRVLLKTSKGDIELELFENEAPNAVANFISLVENKFYDGLSFHRVLGGFMAQGGCPKGDGSGGPGYTIKCECYQPNARLHFRGSLSMAHAGRDTGGSQFFITFLPTGQLNGRHTCFGRVVKGLDVLEKLQRRDPEHLLPQDSRDTILEAKVLRKRPHPYVPVKVADEK